MRNFLQYSRVLKNDFNKSFLIRFLMTDWYSKMWESMGIDLEFQPTHCYVIDAFPFLFYIKTISPKICSIDLQDEKIILNFLPQETWLGFSSKDWSIDCKLPRYQCVIASPSTRK